MRQIVFDQASNRLNGQAAFAQVKNYPAVALTQIDVRKGSYLLASVGSPVRASVRKFREVIRRRHGLCQFP